MLFDPDMPLDAAQVAKASYLLQSAGFDAAGLLWNDTPSVISERLGGPSKRRRRMVLELLECILDPEAA